MQRYYRTAKAITQLNTILLQNLRARISPAARGSAAQLNERFQARGTAAGGARAKTCSSASRARSSRASC